MNINIKDLNKLSFEEALKKLEENVANLEKGDLGLEESLKIYEEGVIYSKYCINKLDAAEKKVEELMSDKNGGIKTKPLDNIDTVENIADNDNTKEV
ncbi:MAG: exodeoxyribonuclease VII small subunit [Candidatus Acididesulfobacter guangdongensis]|uniref:Exodeoxyribonuclease 7 small subunit n=1 Tax=Acididesulfobacter guangdongensis TaxID=2597225 RepID=A0A519BEB8_ACIG2|nr:MAG: exodeoxyribonuclease VII small subunit [Candidatus Acididesulfobacter guangdongensis]